jgi:hypothetical protein
MNNTPVIDLSLRDPQLIITDKGMFRGLVLVLWFRLARPACVGSMWAGITIYAYRYLLPFEQGDLSWAELMSYVAAIGAIGSTLTVWMILARVAHPFASKSRTQRLLRRKARFTVEPGPFAKLTSREWNDVARVFVASHDANGLIAALQVLSEAGSAASDTEARQAKGTHIANSATNNATSAVVYGKAPRMVYSAVGDVAGRTGRR